MKKVIPILALGLICMSQTLLADHTTQQRSSCRILPKYAATAKLKWPGATFYTNNSDNGCSYAQAEIRSEWWTPSQPGGWSFVHMGNDGFWANGDGAALGFKWGDNTDQIPSDFSFSPMIRSKTNGANKMQTSYKGDAAEFDAQNRTITIKNLTAHLGILSQDLKNDYATVQFKIFTESVKDGIGTPLKTIWSAKASIVNGQLLLEGDFTTSEFLNASTGNDINYTLNKTTKTIHIDESVDFETLVFETSGDAGNLGMGVTDKYVPNFSSIEGQEIKHKILAETKFNFDISNKSKEIEINVTKNELNSTIEEAVILNYAQEKVKSITALNADNTQIVSTSDLSKGTYFVRYLINGNYYMKKFII
jgi:hypothetical protein